MKLVVDQGQRVVGTHTIGEDAKGDDARDRDGDDGWGHDSGFQPNSGATFDLCRRMADPADKKAGQRRLIKPASSIFWNARNVGSRMRSLYRPSVT
jgi:hypothetical protein